MKKNYLKPLCIKVPMRVQGPLCESLRIYKNDNVDYQLSRDFDDNNDGGAVSPRSVWDD